MTEQKKIKIKSHPRSKSARYEIDCAVMSSQQEEENADLLLNAKIIRDLPVGEEHVIEYEGEDPQRYFDDYLMDLAEKKMDLGIKEDRYKHSIEFPREDDRRYAQLIIKSIEN